MSKRVSLLIVGAGGYGNNYLRDIFNNMNPEKFEIKGVVDPNPSSCEYLDELNKLNVPFYASIEEFYAVDNADLAVISSPIQYHAYQSCYALEHGSNVLCEKPICAVIQDALRMIEARDKSGKFLAIGYQWSFDDSIIELKKDIITGKLGSPKRLKTLVLWPRNKKYYNRSSWAGKIKDNHGNWILDSVASNATAHYLHNMFFILGDRLDTSAYPVRVKAELYRANNIENFDTCAIQAFTENKVEILYYATHAVKDLKGPIFQYEFENGIVNYGEEQTIYATFSDGTKKVYGSPFSSGNKKLWVCIDAAAGVENNITCNAETAIPHLICINGCQEFMPKIENFPADIVKIDADNEVTWVEGLFEIFNRCYDNGTLPSDENVKWARCGKEVNLTGYKSFEGEF